LHPSLSGFFAPPSLAPSFLPSERRLRWPAWQIPAEGSSQLEQQSRGAQPGPLSQEHAHDPAHTPGLWPSPAARADGLRRGRRGSAPGARTTTHRRNRLLTIHKKASSGRTKTFNETEIALNQVKQQLTSEFMQLFGFNDLQAARDHFEANWIGSISRAFSNDRASIHIIIDEI
jgi:hypothetical protein